MYVENGPSITQWLALGVPSPPKPVSGSNTGEQRNLMDVSINMVHWYAHTVRDYQRLASNPSICQTGREYRTNIQHNS